MSRTTKPLGVLHQPLGETPRVTLSVKRHINPAVFGGYE